MLPSTRTKSLLPIHLIHLTYLGKTKTIQCLIINDETNKSFKALKHLV